MQINSIKFISNVRRTNSRTAEIIEKPQFRLKAIALSIVALLLSSWSLSYGQATNISCNDNGTMVNGSDDYVTFQLNATPPTPHYEAPYTYTMTATQGGAPVSVTLSNGSAATNVPFGIVSPFRTGNGTAGQGNIVVTVTPNFGSSAPVTYTITDPGVCTLPDLCVPGVKTASYKYRSPTSTTDAMDWGTHIPKFNPNSGQTITGVSATLSGTILNSFFLENTGVPAAGVTSVTFNVNLRSNLDFRLNGATIPLTNNVGTYLDETFDLPGRIIVPAGSGWPGDGANSTLYTMAPASTDWLRSRAFTYLDPTADPRWVTNVTGNATHDDDMFISLGNNETATNTISYSSAADLSQFVGSSGNIPLTYSSLTSHTILGGGGNYDGRNYTQTFFEVDLTYTYDETCTALPVKLKSFSGKQAEEAVALTWDVAEEMNVSHYDVEQSVDAKTFHKVSTVSASGKDQYTALDRNPVSGKSYYRLKSVDLDGTFAYSRTISVDFTGDDYVKIFPNPVSDMLSIATENIHQVSKVEILNASGVVIKSLGANEIQKGISVRSLPGGIYIVRIISVNGQNRARSIVVSR